MAKLNKEPVDWITMNGNHIPIYEGQTKQEAIDNFLDGVDERKYKEYWLRNDDDTEFESYTGVSRRDYYKGIDRGGTGYTKPFDRYIPDDVEERVFEALDKIEDAVDFDNFKDKLKQAIRSSDIDYSNFNAIVDAFDDEISAKYNEIIAPRIERINNMNVDESKKIVLKNIFDKFDSNNQQLTNSLFLCVLNCKDDDCQIMLGSMCEMGVGFLSVRKDPIFGNEIGTCYMETAKQINILSPDADTESLYHEGFHAVFHRYDVRHSGLIEILRNESVGAIKELEKYYSIDAWAERNGQTKALNDLREKSKQIKKLNKQWDEELRNAKGWQERNAIDEKYEALKVGNSGLVDTALKIFEERAQFELTNEYTNLNDMLSGATFGKKGFGHKKSYWQIPSEENGYKGDNDDGSNQANEFFAEMASMKATGDKEQYEMVRKFFPNAVAKFEELFKDIVAHRGDILKL